MESNDSQTNTELERYKTQLLSFEDYLALIEKVNDCQALVDDLVKSDKKQQNEKPGFTSEVKKLLKVEF